MGLAYRRAGQGPVLVLVHGYLGGSAQWQHQFADFSGSYDVIAPDLPGFGQSNALPGPARIADFADAVMGCLSDLGVERFTLLGHSMGGMIVQEIAAQHGERLDGLVLYGTGPLGLMPDRFEPIGTSIARLETEGLVATADRISATWFSDGKDAQGYGLTQEIARMANPEAARNALQAMRDWDGRSALTSLRMRGRIIWGDQDKSYRWPQVAQLWAEIPRAELAVIPGASHAAHLEKPLIFQTMLADFLRAAQSQ